MPYIQDPSAGDNPEDLESNQRVERIRIKNRRQIYLDRNPLYFTSPDLELTNPLLYDRCVRRFQSAAEREMDGRAKGYSGVLEADLYRSEAKLNALRMQTSDEIQDQNEEVASSISYIRGANGEVVPEDPDEVPLTKEEGLERWQFELTLRFLKGEDSEFDYKGVDENEDLDAIEKREEEERWFEDEEPEWIDEDDASIEKVGGETGIQDF